MRAHYPDSALCKSCALLVISDLNWVAIDENPNNRTNLFPNPDAVMNHTGSNLWSRELTINASDWSNRTIEITIMRITLLVGQDDLCAINFGLTRNLGARTFFTPPSSYSDTSQDLVVDIYPYFCTQQGVVEILPDVYSPQLKNARPIFVYLPPSIVENPQPRKTNVLVFLDGQYISWFNQTLGAMAVGGSIEETMMVGVPSSQERTYELTFSVCRACNNCPGPDPSWCNCSNAFLSKQVATGGGADLLLDFIEEEVLPLVQTKYGLSFTDRLTRSIAGASLGGLTACYAAYTRSRVRMPVVGCLFTNGN